MRNEIVNAYDELVDRFELQSGDSIWVSSELIGLVFAMKKHGVKFDGNELIDAFQRKVGEEGTILIPTFTYEFSNEGFYDIKNSKSVVGELGNIALSRDDFKRTRHPMHSFAVWGKDQDLLVEMNNLHSFGVDSPFAYCVSHHVKQVMMGVDYIHGMTFVHYAETVCDVPYRFLKRFSGVYVDENGVKENRVCDFAARKLEIHPEEISNLIGKILEEKGISHCIDYEGIENYVIKLDESFPVLCDDIINNQCKNIYEFSIPREEVFKV